MQSSYTAEEQLFEVGISIYQGDMSIPALLQGSINIRLVMFMYLQALFIFYVGSLEYKKMFVNKLCSESGILNFNFIRLQEYRLFLFRTIQKNLLIILQ